MKKHYFFLTQLLFFFLGLKIFSFEPSFVLRMPLTYLLIAVLAIRWLWYKFQTPGKEFFHYKKFWLILFFSSVIVFSLYGPLLNAKWGPIDDHEIMNYLGKNGKISVFDLPPLIKQSEASKPGLTLRYRPVYQLLRLGESFVWGNNPQLWYLTRIIILIFSLSILWFLASYILGVAGAGIFSIYVLAFDYWKDIFTRLGPSETYAVLGLALYALAFSFLWRKKVLDSKQEKYWWIVFLIGAVLCIGSKENFVFMILPNTILFCRLFLLKKLNWWRIGYLTITTLFAGFVFKAVLVATSRLGHDVYDQSTSTGSRLITFIISLKTQQSKYLVLMSLGVASLFAYLKFVAKDKKMAQVTAYFFGILVFLWSLFTFHFVFYNANFPSHSRYDFPGLLFVPSFFIAFFWYLGWFLKEIKVAESIQRGLKMGILVGLCGITVMKGFVGTQVAVMTTVNTTRAFTGRIEELAQKLRVHPDAVVVLESGNVWDYEPIYSNQIFLRAYKVTNPVTLRMVGYSPQTVEAGLEQRLAQTLLNLSQNGNENFLPLSKLDPSKQSCYSLRLSGKAPLLCKEL